jgi:hypothetical protein
VNEQQNTLKQVLPARIIKFSAPLLSSQLLWKTYLSRSVATRLLVPNPLLPSESEPDFVSGLSLRDLFRDFRISIEEKFVEPEFEKRSSFCDEWSRYESKGLSRHGRGDNEVHVDASTCCVDFFFPFALLFSSSVHLSIGTENWRTGITGIGNRLCKKFLTRC